MKKTLLNIIVGLLFFTAYCQTNSGDLPRIVEAERKSAYRLANFTANQNTANYDVVYQRLDLTVNPAVQFVSGSVTTNFTALENMSTLTFDMAHNLIVSAVTYNSASVTFSQTFDSELIINFPSPLTEGGSGTVKVTYSGPPSEGEDQNAFVTGTHNGTPVLWTLSEPYGAKDWWPCKQDLNDKIGSIDVYITAPQQYVAVANGLQINAVTNGDGTKTTHFKHNYPIPAYLVAIAVTNYSIFTQQAGSGENTFPIVNYIYPENLAEVQGYLAVTPPIMDFFEERFEAYPFRAEKYGHAQCGIGGGMEHTTVSFMGYFSRELIAHELAHQWFGDKITCGSWKDIWLNEGFATYLYGLVVEHQDGNDAFTDWKMENNQEITAFPGGSVYLNDSDLNNSERIFSSRLSYSKGAMVVNMLRLKLGNTDFFQGLKNYLADPNLAYGYATTPDLKAHLESASGMNLTEFFNDWIYRQGYPTYSITAQNWAEGKVKITVNQTQSHPSVTYFEMPVPIKLYSPEWAEYDIVVENTFNGQEFIVDVPFAVNYAVFDPDSDIISANSTMTLQTAETGSLLSVQLYPNPAFGQLNVSLPQGIVMEKAVFYNTLGQKTLESNGEMSWNVSGLSTGVHFVTLITNRGSRQFRFIKE